jgi:hypothetical protein
MGSAVFSLSGRYGNFGTDVPLVVRMSYGWADPGDNIDVASVLVGSGIIGTPATGQAGAGSWPVQDSNVILERTFSR